MSILAIRDGPSLSDRVAFVAGQKLASDAEVAYNLKGVLHLSQTGYVLLAVPNAMVRGLFATMHEPGIELPIYHGTDGLNAHITVFRPEEVKQLGGADKLNERGKQFAYTTGRFKTMEPGEHWPGVERVWYIQIHSPELQALRRSYGLSGLPNDGQNPFHVTVAVRKRGILARNDKSKADGST
jgi:hypothetical protein